MDQYRTFVERFSQFIRTQQRRQGKAESFDPILRGQVRGRVGSEPTIGYTADDTFAVRLCDWTSGFFDLSRKEIVEGAVLGRIGLHLDPSAAFKMIDARPQLVGTSTPNCTHQLTQRTLKLETLNEWLDVVLALRRVILFAHL